jgi:predicted DCC family thiol-disulfide oxidoreductase YuxK
MTNPTSEPSVTVYYDGSCPLCTREIALYQRSTGSNRVAWCDISQEPPPPELTRDQAMARFHVQNDKGQMVSGAKAFITLWLSLPRWRWLGRVASVPPLPWILEGVYRLFLPIRPMMQKMARQKMRY